MIQRLFELLRNAILGMQFQTTTDDKETPESHVEQPQQADEPKLEDETPPEEQAEPTEEQADEERLSLWQQFLRAERAHFDWLWDRPYIIAIVIVLAVAIVWAETWLVVAWEWLVAQVTLWWPDLTGHTIALVAVVLAVVVLLFGLRWLRSLDDFVGWVLRGIRDRPRLSAVVGGILLLIALWLINNRGTWIVLPFTVGQTSTIELDGEQVAVQLIAELNQVGVGNPTPVLILLEPLEPRTSSGSITVARALALSDCDTVLNGPGDFKTLQRIPLPRVLTGSQGSRLDLGNLSFGGINVPSQVFTQFLLKVLPSGYRELSGQINENNGELEVSVSSRDPSERWRVLGPSDAFPEMMEYLALRMALDLNPELVKSSGLESAPSDRDLAFAMGNRAFRQQQYRRARAFFQLADRFAPVDEKVNAMLSLTMYHLALEDNTTHVDDDALQAMELAVSKDPNGDSSLLRPYLVCMYHKMEMNEKAEAELLVFNRYLRQLESQDFDARVDALKQLPLRGPGRHLAASGDDVIFLDIEGAIVGGGGKPFEIGLELSDESVRQIGLYKGLSLFFVSSDGAVSVNDYGAAEESSASTTLVHGRALGGVQQVAMSDSQFGRTNLFLLDREGNVYWCDPDAARERGVCSSRPIISKLPNSRQIFPVGDRIYVLSSDGAVWHTRVRISGFADTPSQLTPPDSVQEIFVAGDGTLYLLQDNGNVKRHYDDGRPETEDLKLIDTGTNTAQIFAAGDYLYLLKNDGAIWRISNPRNPDPKVDFVEIAASQEGVKVQEMFVTLGPDSGNRVIYLLTDQRVLLRGTDTGEARVTFSSDNVPVQSQMVDVQ